ncbi:MAG: hypothetical protein WC150_00155 [Bacteroidia bacterium]
MKILLVGGVFYRERVVKLIVGSGLTCRENIVQVATVNEAINFIENQVQNKSKKQHLDLIIVDDTIDLNRHQNNLCDWIRSCNGSFSDFNFRLSSIPVILFKEGIERHYNSSSLYSATLPLTDNANDDRLFKYSNQLVKDWRGAILNDISHSLGIDINKLRLHDRSFVSIVSDYKSTSANSSYYLTKTKVVSKEFIQSPKFPKYDWFQSSRIGQAEQALEKYSKIISGRVRYFGRAYERQVQHAFYNQFPFVLTRDTYSRKTYERRVYVNRDHFTYHIPDYVLSASFPGYTNTSITEIKRHNITFEGNPRRHENFSFYTGKALHQVSNYEDSFQNIYGEKLQVDLIIGLENNLTDYFLRQIEKHYKTINLVTHDQMIASVEEYYNRLLRLSV